MSNTVAIVSVEENGDEMFILSSEETDEVIRELTSVGADPIHIFDGLKQVKFLTDGSSLREAYVEGRLPVLRRAIQIVSHGESCTPVTIFLNEYFKV